jgi:UDP:flavonoid glycosyltransferase YjiC (YdhE family)
MLSKLDLNRAQLTTALEKIVADDRYRQNMLRLKQIQDQVDGATNAARQIVNFLEGKR